MAPKWEYTVSVVLDDVRRLNALMEQYAEHGWELVNGTVTSYVEGVNRLRIHYAQYWRRPIK